MNKTLNREKWEELFDGFTIVDCVILTEQVFGFVLVEVLDGDSTSATTRFLNISSHQPMEDRFAYAEGNTFSFPNIAMSQSPLEYVAVDTKSNVYSASIERMGEEAAIDQLLDMSTYNGLIGIINKLVRVAGKIYALGDYRKIYRRIGFEQWIELGTEGHGVPPPAYINDEDDSSMEYGFEDMSGFSSDDMYAVGGEGDVWRFDGAKWHQCPVPTNASLKTVCCAGDGVVYITEINGTVWAGRTDTWRRIAGADISPAYAPVDSFWFNDRLYLGGQEGIWTVDAINGRVVRLQEIETDAPNVTNSGRLDISVDGNFLLTAGPYGACIHDGTAWRRLFSAFDYL
ncbi:hypothetical protein INH39_01835 [Massilia violaceinigra]|uniref:Photosynthesis system II assembly factor Ycf48/Hcf136-like domain-containing protein n=1 Tax=Massilia violaceinigra TaxID=2045208 RepID=A0ABY4A6V8_9BURK|nr:hypothetical protein [Massilia violaceinigra]UOD30516.1 hypothetical protein INH39_01835 [Massilia violaceinigra]